MYAAPPVVFPRHGTLGDAWRAGWQIQVRCAWGKRDGMKSVREWITTGELDLRKLMWTRGAEMLLGMLAERLKCPTCGSRRVLASFVPPGGAAASR